MGVKFAAVILFTSAGSTVSAFLFAVMQTPAIVLDEKSLMPVGVAVAVLLVTVGATIRVVRWIDKVNARLKKLEEAGLLPPEKP